MPDGSTSNASVSRKVVPAAQLSRDSLSGIRPVKPISSNSYWISFPSIRLNCRLMTARDVILPAKKTSQTRNVLRREIGCNRHHVDRPERATSARPVTRTLPIPPRGFLWEDFEGLDVE